MLDRTAYLVLIVSLLACDTPGASQAGDATTTLRPDTSDGENLANACLGETPCAEDFDCAGGERCNHALTRPMCQTITCGDSGTPCDDDVLCAPGLVCLGEERVCGRRAAGESCAAPSECADGLTCPDTVGHGETLQPFINDRGEPMLWPDGGCIKIVYAPAASAFVPGLMDALDAWLADGCSRLCFEAPVASEDWYLTRGPAVLISEDDMWQGGYSAHSDTNGDMQFALIEANAHVMALPRWRTLATGTMLGFYDGFDASVLGSDNDVTAPTAADRADVCAWYPERTCR